MKYYTIYAAAKISGLCAQSISVKFTRMFFKNAKWCECGLSRLIPEDELIEFVQTRPDRRTSENRKKIRNQNAT